MIEALPYTNTPLHPHQKQGVHKARTSLKHHKGVLIGDEMGLGKTLEAIHCFCPKLLKKIQHKSSCKILILAPLSVLIEWKMQLKTHMNQELFPPSSCLVAYYSQEQGKTLTAEKRKTRLQEWFTNKHASFIILASYGTLRNDASFLFSYRWHFVVMDECHCLKNEQSRVHNVLCTKLSKKTKRIGLSGTPNANHPVRDLCALSKLLFPRLYDLHHKDNYKNNKPPLLNEVIVRRTLDDIGATLPPLNIKTIHLRFTEASAEWTAYREQLKKTMKAMYAYINACRYNLPNTMMLLRAYQCAINMLGKTCSHYQISDVRKGSVNPLDTATTTKEKYVCDTICDYAIIEQKKLIVVSASSTFLNIIHAKINDRYEGTTICFTGETPCSEREHVLNKWRHPDGPNVLLLSMKAGGVGLTLIEAHRMICVDGFSQPNPADREQALKRVHRFGQIRAVQIDDLCVEGTIDEVMKDFVHPSKQNMSRKLLHKMPRVKQSSAISKTKTTTTEELCAIGKSLLPIWKKTYEPTPPEQANNERSTTISQTNTKSQTTKSVHKTKQPSKKRKHDESFDFQKTYKRIKKKIKNKH